MFRRILPTLAVVAFAGCDIDFRPIFGINPNQPTSGKALLVQFESEQELRDYIAEQSQNSFRGGIDDVFFFEDADNALGGPVSESAPTAGGDGGAVSGDAVADGTDNPQFSQTTEQEEGVQEADVLKTDGVHIYIMSENVLRIVQTDPLEEVGSVDLNGFGRDLYLAGDRLVAITSPDAFVTDVAQASDALSIFAPEFFQPQTEVTVIDVTDRSDPKVMSRSRLDGSINTSRMIDDRLFLVVTNFPNHFIPEFDSAPLDTILPDIAVQVGDDEPVIQSLAKVADHFHPVDADGFGFTTVVSMDIDDPAGYQAQTVVAQPANVYASSKALYLTDSEFKFDGAFRETTSIYKFDFTDAGVNLSAGGQVPGRVLNQYSMSEYQGFLRLATTDRRDSFAGSQTANNVYVLEQIEDRLEQAGSVEGLAPGESIFSARFVGDRGYLVTFEQIDPLFTLDLSDPRSPKAVGELKVPGFSTFILPMGNDHLLTIGRDTSDDFGFVRAEGVRLSVFDVSDFENPSLAHFEVIGANGGSSEALFNPKAFTYFAEGDMVAFPMDIYDFGEPVFGPIDVIEIGDVADGGGSTDASPPPDENGSDEEPVDSGPSDEPPPNDADFAPQPRDEFTGVYVYRVTADAGFEFLGRISTRPTGDEFDFFFPSFSRGVFIDDMFYAVTSLSVQAAPTSDLTNPVGKVQFPPPKFEDAIPLPVDGPIAIDAEQVGGDDGGRGGASTGGSGETGADQPSSSDVESPAP